MLKFWQDSNAGLVSQVIDAYRKFSILELEKTYSALTVAEIARCTSSDPDDYAETGRYLNRRKILKHGLYGFLILQLVPWRARKNSSTRLC